MQKAVQAAQIHKYAEVSDIFHDAFAQLADLDFRQDFFFAGLAFFLDEFSSGYDDVSAFNIDFENLALHLLADESADVPWFSDIDLRSRQEHRHSNVDKQPAFDAPYHLALNCISFLFGIDNRFPASDGVGFAFA